MWVVDQKICGGGGGVGASAVERGGRRRASASGRNAAPAVGEPRARAPRAHAPGRSSTSTVPKVAVRSELRVVARRAAAARARRVVVGPPAAAAVPLAGAPVGAAIARRRVAREHALSSGAPVQLTTRRQPPTSSARTVELLRRAVAVRRAPRAASQMWPNGCGPSMPRPQSQNARKSPRDRHAAHVALVTPPPNHGSGAPPPRSRVRRGAGSGSCCRAGAVRVAARALDHAVRRDVEARRPVEPAPRSTVLSGAVATRRERGSDARARPGRAAHQSFHGPVRICHRSSGSPSASPKKPPPHTGLDDGRRARVEVVVPVRERADGRVDREQRLLDREHGAVVREEARREVALVAAVVGRRVHVLHGDALVRAERRPVPRLPSACGVAHHLERGEHAVALVLRERADLAAPRGAADTRPPSSATSKACVRVGMRAL